MKNKNNNCTASTLQVLVSTMNLNDCTKLCDNLNINSDVLVINQSDNTNFDFFEYKGNKCECYTFKERGLSRSRNEALMRATGDIICIADDDMKYSDTYKIDILEEFNKHPDADAIVFNVDLINSVFSSIHISKFSRVGKFESRQYGSVHIALRREKILYNNLFFNIMFGTGSYYKCGEDTIFLKKLLDCGLRLYKSPIVIGQVDMSDSTWFKGYNKKYYLDKGAIIAAVYPRISIILIVIQSIRNSKKHFGSFRYILPVLKSYLEGYKDFKKKSCKCNN